MTVRRILQLSLPADAERLRRRSIKVKKLGEPAVRQLVEDLLDTFHAHPAYGLAAPQIGELLRVIVVALGEEREVRVLINPEILRASPEAVKDYDGCLSIPSIYAQTRRAAAIVVQGKDPDGRTVRLKLDDFDARVVQHEIDHLDGVLFIDRLDSLEDLYTLRPVPAAEGEAETLEEVPPAPEQLELVRRNARPLPDWAIRWPR